MSRSAHSADQRPQLRLRLQLALGALTATALTAGVLSGVLGTGSLRSARAEGEPSADSVVAPAPPARPLASGATTAAMGTDTIEVSPAPAALTPQSFAGAAAAIAEDAAAEDAASAGPATADPGTDGAESPAPTVGVRSGTGEPFVAIGASWTGPASAVGAVRVRTGDGSWSAWHVLEAEGGEGGDTPAAEDDTATSGPPLRSVSAPIWVGNADAWEIALDASQRDVRVHLVRARSESATVDPGAMASPAVLAAAAASGPLTQQAVAIARPPIWSRSAWGARTPSSDTWTAHSLRLVVVHHTGSGESANYAQSSVPAMLRAIQAYHMDANGWNDIGYNFVVDRFGAIWEARAGGVDKLVVGAHAYGANTGSVGIAVLGDFSTAAPSQPALDGVAALAAWKLFRHGADPRVPATFLPRATEKFTAGQPVTLHRVVGHRDVSQTGCPGNLYASIPSLRTDIVSRYLAMIGDGTFADRTVDRAVTGFPVLGDFNADGISDVFWYRSGPAADELWSFRSDATFVASTYDVTGDFRTRVLDWDGDGADDLIFYSATSGVQARMLAGARSGPMQLELLPASGDYVPFAGDFNGDGDDDIVWYSPTRRDAWIWAYDNGTIRSKPVSDMPGPFRLAAGDFNGDTRTDLLWYGPAGAADSLWYGEGDLTFRKVAAQISGDFWPFVADLDGDQRDDVIWTTTSGPMPLWWGGDTFTGSVSDFGPQLAYRTVDVNGGGIADVLTIGYDGQVTAWLGSRSGVVTAGRTGSEQVTLPLVGDFNGDGRSDVIWWRSGQSSAFWLAT